MFDPRKLYNSALVLMAVAIVFQIITKNSVLSGTAAAASFVLIGLYASMQARMPNAIDLREIFSRNVETNALHEALAQDPEAAQALAFFVRLSPTDFLRFNRLAIEMRYNNDQAVLSHAARQYRKENP